MAVVECRHFNGYKPCGLHQDCDQKCPLLDIPAQRILIIHLGAIGAVVRATSLLQPIKRKYPSSHLTWVTDAPSQQLLNAHPLLDRVLTTQAGDLLSLSALEFDIAFVIDKSLKASAILKATKADEVYGFVADAKTGAILPANPQARELWEIGLSNDKKFFENKKAETQLLVEALNLGPWQRDEYHLPLTAAEQVVAKQRHHLWSEKDQKIVIGLNTGCSPTIPYKKLSVEFQRKIIQELLTNKQNKIVLLGGPEDTERNEEIAQGLDVINSETTAGLRDGLVSVDACDIVITGDSLGMHMAIARKKWVVAWFGPTCAHEIDLYGRGMAVLSQAECAPCWKRTCQKSRMCYDQVSIDEIMNAVRRGQEYWRQKNVMSLSKQPSLEISF